MIALTLLDMVAHIREVTGKPVGLKLVIGGCNALNELFGEIQRKGHDSTPDFITLDGSDSGTGAAPQPLMDFMGLPLKESLPILIDQLVGYSLRNRVRVIARSCGFNNPKELTRQHARIVTADGSSPGYINATLPFCGSYGVSRNHVVTALVMNDLPECQTDQKVAACAVWQCQILG